jgi:hypothetical protein
MMPTYERRFFLGLLTKDYREREEHQEKMREQQSTKSGKGSRTSRVSGSALKQRLKNGDIPLS